MEKRTRDPEKTRAHILEVAFTEIYQRGFQGVSINDIIAKTEVSKGAFFHYFATKNDLGYALVDEVIKQMVLDRWIKPLSAHKNPVKGIIKNFKKIIDTFPEKSVKYGCPLNNLIQEMAPVDPVFRDKLYEALEVWISETEKYLRKAQIEGYLKKGTNTRQLAEFIVMVEEGSFGLAKSMQNKKMFTSFYNSLNDYLSTLSN